MVRVKNRYFLVEIKYADQRRLQRNVSSEAVYKSVRQAVQDSYGDYGVGALKDSLMVKYLNADTNLVIIRAKRDHHHMAQAAFTCIKKIGDHDCYLHTLHIGGTIRACQKFLIKHHRRHLPVP
ncbi:ribonuclease P/MRP protein subunit POP5-like [Babylonia areolata]|uniref:ribonuclease P/MRP protein subunit POP5-like n=1 Tax=Babylonia areolata TaxID=304850 RepID=UPI003FD12D2C